MIVVDSNVVAALCFASPHSAAAEAIWRQDPHWLAPPLLHSELLSVAAKYVAAGLADERTCSLALRNSRWFVHTDTDLAPADLEILRLAAGCQCSTYDCEFVWLALALAVPLVTWDQRVLAAFRSVAVTPEEYVD